MFNVRKYLKVRDLERILFGGPEVTTLLYEPNAEFRGDSLDRTKDFVPEVDDNTLDLDTSNSNIWYRYEFDKQTDNIRFTLPE